MSIRYRIRKAGGGEYLADYVDQLGDRRAKRFENREAAEAFLAKLDLSHKESVRAIEPDPVEDAA